jgi:hypothetical protein
VSGWDALRAKQRGERRGDGVPTCSRCGAVSVLDPCRSCASTDELALYPEQPDPAA